ncbi:MAG: hypothetical protein ABIN25_13010 [Ginsengibacter sp.]
MQNSTRPPTKRMIAKLKECLEKEAKNNGVLPCLPEEMKSSLAGLYKRGLIQTRMDLVDNKKQLCIYISEEGRKFLTDLEST